MITGAGVVGPSRSQAGCKRTVYGEIVFESPFIDATINRPCLCLIAITSLAGYALTNRMQLLRTRVGISIVAHTFA